MKKRVLALLLVFVLMVAYLTGCGCKHEWTEATCAAPQTCGLCGETEGDALPHEWMDANYQTPKTCSVCSETEGEPLTASFEAHGLSVLPVEENVAHEYVTTCNTDNTKKTTGALYLENYTRFEGDDTHEALEGYEWVTLNVKVRFDDENANKYGMIVNRFHVDYHDVDGWDNGEEIADRKSVHTVNWNGVDYDRCIAEMTPITFSKWKNNECWSTTTFSFRVPYGYDGVVIGFFDGAITPTEGQDVYDIVDENTLLFRLA